MDAARQTLRWSVPGSVFILLVYSIQLGFYSYFDVRHLAVSALSVLAGIPIGFLIYQFYYMTYKPTGWSPFLWLGGYFRFVRLNRGAFIMARYFASGGTAEFLRYVSDSGAVTRAIQNGSDLDSHPYARLIKPRPYFPIRVLRISDVVFDSTTRRSCKCSQNLLVRLILSIFKQDSWDVTGCRCARKVYARYFHQDWGLIQCCLDVVDTFDSGKGIKTEYTTGSDLYHAIGSVKAAVIIAVASTGSYDLFRHHEDLLMSWRSQGTFIIGLTAIAFVLWFPLARTRARTRINYEARIAASLAWFARDGKWNKVSELDDNRLSEST
jgi:hypothetical protein